MAYSSGCKRLGGFRDVDVANDGESQLDAHCIDVDFGGSLARARAPPIIEKCL